YGYVTTAELAGMDLKESAVIDLETFRAVRDRDTSQVIDVRTEAEYRAVHIPGTDHIVLASLESRLDAIERNKRVIIHCQSGVRAAMAYSMLKRHGFHQVLNYAGGMNEWKEQAYESIQ